MFRDASGKRYVGGLGVDITERKQAEDALLREQGKLENLTSKLLMAQESERRRIVGELHDDFTQRLAALTIDLLSLGAQASESNASFVPRLTQAGEVAKQLTTELQRLAHQPNLPLDQATCLYRILQETYWVKA